MSAFGGVPENWKADALPADSHRLRSSSRSSTGTRSTGSEASLASDDDGGDMKKGKRKLFRRQSPTSPSASDLGVGYSESGHNDKKSERFVETEVANGTETRVLSRSFWDDWGEHLETAAGALQFSVVCAVTRRFGLPMITAPFIDHLVSKRLGRRGLITVNADVEGYAKSAFDIAKSACESVGPAIWQQVSEYSNIAEAGRRTFSDVRSRITSLRSTKPSPE